MLCVWIPLVAVLHLALLCRVAVAEHGDAIPVPSPRIITLASEPISDLALVVGSDGEPLAAWLTADDSGSPQLALAYGPIWDIERQSLEEAGGAASHLSGAWAEHPALWWIQVGEQHDWAMAWDGSTGSLLPARAVPPGAVPAHSATGRAESLVWWADGALWAMDDTGAERLVVSDAESAADLVAAQRDAGLVLAWRGADGAIYAHVEAAESRPVQLAAAGERPELVCGSSGCHLFWLQEGQVWTSTGPDWGAPVPTGAIPEGEASWAPAMGSMGQVHLLWAQDGGLWHAFSDDWPATRQSLGDGAGIVGMAAAIGRQGALHLLWAEASEAQAPTLRYLRWDPRLPQTRIVGPAAGECVYGDMAVFLETNLDRAEVAHVSFYLEAAPEADDAVSGTLLALETTWSSDDGWSTRLDGAVHGAPYLQRVVAQMHCTDGTARWAWGEWFALTRADAPLLWVEDDARVVVNLPGEDALLPTRLDLYLEPRLDTVKAAVLPASYPEDLLHIFVGSLFPEHAGRHTLDLPLTDLPDGAYSLRLWVEAQGERYLLPVAPPVVIRSSGLPRLSVEVPAATASAQETLLFEAEAGDADGSVTQVSFYLVSPPEAASQRAIWLGTDTDGSDGWSVRARPGEEGLWQLRAEAIDDDGQRNVALSGDVMLLTSPALPKAEFVTPRDGSVVRGDKTVRLAVDSGGAAVERTTLMIAPEQGDYEILGALVPEAGELRYSWDTSRWPDGVYRLAALLEFAGGRTALVETEAEIANHPVALRIVWPRAGDAVRGWQLVRLVPSAMGGEVRSVMLYARDASGELFPVGPARPQDDAWVASWPTETLLDGAYDLVAYVDGIALRTTDVRVEVANSTPSLGVAVRQGDEDLAGLAELAWTVSDLGDRQAGTLSVSLSYSPSGGRTWLPIASHLSLSGTVTLETRDLPDSHDGWLRIQVQDGARAIVTTERPLVVNNVNEEPYLRLLTPQNGELLGGSTVVAWESLDVDSVAWRAGLAYRRHDGEWIPLADDLDATGRYLWDLSALTAGDGYALRLIVRDEAGNEAIAIADNLTLRPNAPPTVRLIAPGAGAVFESEVGLLWEANDPDGDRLRVTVDYSHNAGVTWLPVAEDSADSGYLEWYVAYLPPGRSYRLRVTVSDGVHTAQATSGTFGIGPEVAPRLALLAPEAGQEVSGHTVVHWRAETQRAHLMSASVLVRRKGESAWQTLAANIPNDGHFLWDTTGLRDGHYELLVRVTDGTRTSGAELAEPILVNNHGCPRLYLEIEQPWMSSPWTGVRELVWRLTPTASETLTGTLLLRAPGASEWQAVTTFDPTSGRLLVDARQIDDVATAELALSISSACDAAQLDLGPVISLGHYGGSPPTAELHLLRGHELSPDDHALAWQVATSGGRPVTAEVWQTADGLALEPVLTEMASNGTYWLTTEEARAFGGALLGLTVSDELFRVRTPTLAGAALLPSREPLATPELHTPLYGDVVSGTVSIEWAIPTAHPDAQITISVSSNGGLEWRKLATISAQEGRYAWDTVRFSNGPCLLQVALEQEGWHSGVQVVGLEISNPGRHAPIVGLTMPEEDVPWSGPRRITWVSHDADGDDLSMNLAYSVNDGRTWYVIARGLEDTGAYLLDTSVLPNADRVYLRITASDGVFRTSAVGAAPVAVRDPGRPWVELVAPEAGQRCAGLQEIRWWGFNPNPREAVTVRIELSDDRGATWQEVASGLELTGSLAWDTRDIANGTAVWLRAVVLDGSGTMLAAAALPGPVYVQGNAHPYALPLGLP